jgi:hypothetical protein
MVGPARNRQDGRELEHGGVSRRGQRTSVEDTMNRNVSTLRIARALGWLGLSAVLLTTSGTRVLAHGNDGGWRNAPVGAWAVQVTLRDCASNAPLGAPFNSLVTFHAGGTLSESSGSVTFAPGQRTAGHGSWQEKGRRTFSQRLTALVVFDTAANLPGTPAFNPTLPVSPGFFAGWSVVTHTVKLTDSDHLESVGVNEFFKSDGTSYRSGCSTAVGQRLD